MKSLIHNCQFNASVAYVNATNGEPVALVVLKKVVFLPNKGTKGLTGANRTSFKKGQDVWNRKHIGYERIDKKDGYVHIKIAEPNVFVLKHRHVWEKHNGPVPDKHVIAFKNQDKTDCRIENLILMSKAEMVRYSQSFHKLANKETNETCLIMAKVKTKAHQLKNGDCKKVKAGAEI